MTRRRSHFRAGIGASRDSLDWYLENCPGPSTTDENLTFPKARADFDET